MRVWQDNMEHGTTPDAKPAAFARVLCRTFLRGMLAVYVLLLCACTDSPLDPDKPVTLTMWHVYGAQARSPMNMLIDRFNQTVGKEQGIIIGHVLGSESELDGGTVGFDGRAGKRGMV